MNFVEAAARAKAAVGLPIMPIFVGMSGTGRSLTPYLRAYGVEHGYDLQVEFAPFGTLNQTVLGDGIEIGREIYILFPWDFLTELDWRTGFSEFKSDGTEAMMRARTFRNALAARTPSAVLYIDAPIPPTVPAGMTAGALAAVVRSMAAEVGARILGADCFSLGSYLASGAPIGGRRLSSVAKAAIGALFAPPAGKGKVLVTDFDEVLWSGVIAEDGIEGVSFGPEGRGHKHFLYQSFLKNLRTSGVLLAGVSRNDPATAVLPLKTELSVLNLDDFVAVKAGYGAKSAEISALCDGLNIGLDAVLFVDDNPVELAEVEAALPEVTTLRFPPGEDDLPDFFDAIVRFFGRSATTGEDRNRTELYRRRLETTPPTGGSKGDIRRFLKDLGMRLTIFARGRNDMERAFQLFSKTNQFNANGRRPSKDELIRAMEQGAWLLTAMLDDRSGSHGEIMVCLAEPSGKILGLAMSCRVFERRVEFAFIDWLARKIGRDLQIDYRPTDRNKPFRDFLAALGVATAHEESVSVKSAIVNQIGDANRDLFEVRFQST